MEIINNEYDKKPKSSSFFKRFALMFAIFYTSLTILSKLAINYGFLTRNFMENLLFGVINAAVLSFIFVVLIKRDDA